jgi:hypothetical protein
MIDVNLTEEECKMIKRQRVLALLHPPSQETMNAYGSLKNYLNPRFIPDNWEQG